MIIRGRVEPPLVIFLDMLFILLFLFYHNARVMEVKLPPGPLFSGAKIVYLDERENRYREVDASLFSPGDSAYLRDCEQRIDECRKVMPAHPHAYIVYPRDLEEKLGQLSLLALGTGTCSSLDLTVTASGKLDYARMIDDNRCLKNLKGFSAFVRSVGPGVK